MNKGMTAMKNYWESRTLQNEKKALALATSYSKRAKAQYDDANKAIQASLNDLMLDILTGGTPTRSQLWRATKYIRLRNVIQETELGLSQSQIELVDALLPKIFEETIGATFASIYEKSEAYNVLSDTLLKQALDTSWSGKNYSDRIWLNANNLAKRLEKDIADMIVLGKNPNEIKSQIAKDFAVSYSATDRLIRTESAHIYTQASITAYKTAGIKQVKYLHGGNCSDKCDCHSLDGKIFDIGTEPTLPRHPNCICCYAPVVDLTVAESSGKIGFEKEDLNTITSAFPKYGTATNPKKVTITHGGKHADKRLAQRGITLDDAQHYVDTAIIAFQQSADKAMYLSREGVAIVLDNGGLASAFPASCFDDKTQELLKEVEKVWRK